jgi:hypothetical protein
MHNIINMNYDNDILRNHQLNQLKLIYELTHSLNDVLSEELDGDILAKD